MGHRYDPDVHHRRSIRLPEYDYAQSGAYFVTICSQGRDTLFGRIVEGEIKLSHFGQVVTACWNAIPSHFPCVELDAFVVMPNHLHGILILRDPENDPATRTSPNVTPPHVGAKHSQRNITPAEPRLIANASPSTQQDIGHPSSSGTQYNPDSPFQKVDPSLADSVGGETEVGSLAAIIQNFKALSTRRINQARRSPGGCVWQRGYYEHVLRDERDMDRSREYIVLNPARWEEDACLSANIGP